MGTKALESIEIEGFLSIRSASVSLGRLNVLVGANGAGKSNLVTAFELVSRLADNELDFFVARSGGASALLNDSPRSRSVQLRLTWQDLDPFEAELVPAADDRLIYARGGSFDIGQVLDLMRGFRVYHFHDTSFDAPVKQMAPTADNLALHGDAGNLAAVLLALRDTNESAYQRILGVIRQVAPFFRDFVLRPERSDRIRLRWRQVDTDTIFSANQMSDGTLRFICLATLLLHPGLPAVVVLDEPELGLHPFAIVQLAGLLRQASVRSQVILATQSVTLMNQFQIEDLIVAERAGGGSKFYRPDPARLAEWLEDYSLGELWEKNLIGGRPARER